MAGTSRHVWVPRAARANLAPTHRNLRPQSLRPKKGARHRVLRYVNGEESMAETAGSRDIASLAAELSGQGTAGVIPSAVFKARWLDTQQSAQDDVDTVQLISVTFKIKYKGAYGEGLRLVGGHEALGNWDLQQSVLLNWDSNNVWVTEPIELPVDGVYVYKYVVCEGGDAKRPSQWQSGNNQVLVLSNDDSPAVVVNDNWRADPALAFTCKPDGSEALQAEHRLIGRVQNQDLRLQVAEAQVGDLQERLRKARYETKALREEAKIGANARLALKAQLAAERARNDQLEQRMLRWSEEEERAQQQLREVVSRAKQDVLPSPKSEAGFLFVEGEEPMALGDDVDATADADVADSAATVVVDVDAEAVEPAAEPAGEVAAAPVAEIAGSAPSGADEAAPETVAAEAEAEVGKQPKGKKPKSGASALEDVASALESVGDVVDSVGKVFSGSETKSPHQWWKKKKQ